MNMKMKKFLFGVLPFILIGFSSLTLQSCVDETFSEDRLLIGTWTSPYNDRVSTLTFTVDGRFNKYVYGTTQTGEGTYSYNEKQATLVLSYDRGLDKLYSVQTLTSQKLVLIDGHLNVETWTKEK